MEYGNYLIALFVSFFGLYVGVLISYLTKEEYKEIKKGLNLVSFGVLMGICIATFLGLGLDKWMSVFFVILIALTVYNLKVPTWIIYTVFGFLFYISSYIDNLMIIITFLIFAYGIVTATFFTNENLKKGLRFILSEITVKHVAYIIIALILIAAI